MDYRLIDIISKQVPQIPEHQNVIIVDDEKTDVPFTEGDYVFIHALWSAVSVKTLRELSCSNLIKEMKRLWILDIDRQYCQNLMEQHEISSSGNGDLLVAKSGTLTKYCIDETH